MLVSLPLTWCSHDGCRRLCVSRHFPAAGALLGTMGGTIGVSSNQCRRKDNGNDGRVLVDIREGCKAILTLSARRKTLCCRFTTTNATSIWGGVLTYGGRNG